ncbi:MAG: HAD hydrolase-like protein [Inquilinaceae bacterium]
MPRTAILFDLDGTLTDPRQGIVGCILHAFERLGRPAPPAASLDSWIGPPLRDSFAGLLGDGAEADRAVAFYRERFADTGLYENRVYDGVPEMLDTVAGAGHRIYLATSKPWPFAARILTHFGLDRWFDGVHGAELDGTRGTKGDLLRYVLDRRALTPASTVMVGDRKHDAIGAAQAGIRCVMVAYGYGDAAELSAHAAVPPCAAPADIPPSLDRLLANTR